MKRAATIAIVLSLASGCGSSSAIRPDGGGGGDGGDTAVETGNPSCAWDAVYDYGSDGGLVAYRDQTTLTPPDGYLRSRDNFGNAAPITCAPAMPTCGSSPAVDVGDIMGDITAPDVQAALAETTPPIYGTDPRPVDGIVFKFLRADGRGFFAGGDCPSPPGGCVPVPAGVARLVADLRALDTQQLMDPTCAQLR